MKSVFISGITSQSSFYLVRDYLARKFKVFGLKRRASTDNTEKIREFLPNPNLQLVQGDLTDATSLHRILREVKPDIILHNGAQSHVRISFDEPAHTFDVTAKGTLNLLEAVRHECPTSRVVLFSSSEMFGNNKDDDGFQRETTPFAPASPYGVAKLASHQLGLVYRKSYGLHVSSAICFNFESPYRGENFVTRKIIKYLSNLINTKTSLARPVLKLGNLEAQRDWNFAGDTMKAVQLMADAVIPDDYVIASGETHSVREFFETALDLIKDEDEIFGGRYTINDLYEEDSSLLRPYEVDYLKGDSSKIRRKLGWKPQVDFKGLVKIMMEADLNFFRGGSL